MKGGREKIWWFFFFLMDRVIHGTNKAGDFIPLVLEIQRMKEDGKIRCVPLSKATRKETRKANIKERKNII